MCVCVCVRVRACVRAWWWWVCVCVCVCVRILARSATMWRIPGAIKIDITILYMIWLQCDKCTLGVMCSCDELSFL